MPRFAVAPFIQSVEKASNGRIKFDYFPSEQLGKANTQLTLAQSGAAGIAGVAPPFHSDKMQLSSVIELPGLYNNSCEGTLAFYKLATEGAMQQPDFASNSIVPIMVLAMPPYRLFTRERKVDAIEAFKGLKIRSSGGGMNLALQKLDAVPVRMASPEIFESLQRGTIDGVAYAYSNLVTNGFTPLVKYGIESDAIGGGAMSYSMGESTWRGLTEDNRKVIRAEAGKSMRNFCENAQKDDEEFRPKAIEGGVQMITWSEAERNRFVRAVSAVAEEWAESLEKRGQPAKRTLEEFRAEVAKVRRGA